MTTLAMNNYNGFIILDNFQAPSAYERVWSRSLAGRFSFGSNSLSNRIDTTLTFLLSNSVVIADRLLVEDFLANHSGMVTHLYTIPNKVSEYFDTNSIELGIFSDPDTADTSELYFEIQTSLSPEDANRQLSLINRQWIFASADEDLMGINFTLRFV